MRNAIKREMFFECVLVSDRNEYRFHFRAWNALDAERCLREELQYYGVTANGELRVLDTRGRLVHVSAYDPAGGAGA